MQLELPMTLAASIEFEDRRAHASVDPTALAAVLERVAELARRESDRQAHDEHVAKVSTEFEF